ncbi:GNAT family N-acetyltransferase, partial [Pantoea agglomerans]|uniref:GNAT family N-acetyltransferase n=1 Tax=Enterobacter agglomerans TaxID=549 RepID=UPI003208451E
RESAELGIALSQKVWRTGVGTRAAGLVISHAFNVLNFKRISANHQPDNHASEKLLTKLGFKLEGIARGYTKNKDGELTDVVQYGLLKEPKVKETSRFRTDQTWKDTRNHYLKVLGKPWYQLLAELQNTLSFATFEFYNLRKIKTLHLPITTGSISSPMGKGSDSLPVKVKMYEQDVYLADSMQFMLEYGTRLFGNGAWYMVHYAIFPW